MTESEHEQNDRFTQQALALLEFVGLWVIVGGLVSAGAGFHAAAVSFLVQLGFAPRERFLNCDAGPVFKWLLLSAIADTLFVFAEMILWYPVLVPGLITRFSHALFLLQLAVLMSTVPLAGRLTAVVVTRLLRAFNSRAKVRGTLAAAIDQAT